MWVPPALMQVRFRLPPDVENPHRQTGVRGLGSPAQVVNQPPRWIYGHPDSHFNTPPPCRNGRGIPPTFVPPRPHRKFYNQMDCQNVRGIPATFLPSPPNRNFCNQMNYQNDCRIPPTFVRSPPNLNFYNQMDFRNGRGIPPTFMPSPPNRNFYNQMGWTSPMSRENAMAVAARDPQVQKLADTQKKAVGVLFLNTKPETQLCIYYYCEAQNHTESLSVCKSQFNQIIKGGNVFFTGSAGT